jgi:hypothetical protein
MAINNARSRNETIFTCIDFFLASVIPAMVVSSVLNYKLFSAVL